MTEQVIYCPNCGGENQRSYRFCMYCGATLQTSTGSAQPENSPGDAPVAPPPPPPQPPSQVPESTAPTAPPPKRRRSALTCAVLVIIALCVCVGLAAFAWNYGDYLLQMLGLNIY